MKKHGFRYREAANGLEAVNLYQATASPRFNVVLMGMLSSFASLWRTYLSLPLLAFVIPINLTIPSQNLLRFPLT